MIGVILPKDDIPTSLGTSSSSVPKEVYDSITDAGYDADYVMENDKPVDLAKGAPRQITEISLMSNPLWIESARKLMPLFAPTEKVELNLDDFDADGNMKDEAAAQWGLEAMGWFNYNLPSMGYTTAKLQNAPNDQKLALYYMMQLYDEKEISWNGAKRLFYGLAADPSTYFGLTTLGVGALLGAGAKQATKAGFRQALKSSLPATAVAAIEGGAYSSLDDALRQEVSMEAGAQQEFDVGRNVQAGGIGTVAGGGLGALAGIAPELIREGGQVISDIAREAQQGTMFSGIPTRGNRELDNPAWEVSNEPLGDDVWNEPLPVDPAPVFYSAVANAVDALPMEKGNASQMRAMIAKSAEVKPEEMAWIGLDDFLKGKKSVTKQEIRDFVDANQVQIEEVVRADEGVTQEIGYLRRRHEMMVEGSGDYADLPPSLREERAAKMLADIEAMEASNVVGRPKFSPDNHPDLSLPGGKNYREVLLRLPTTRRMSFDEFLDSYKKRFRDNAADPSQLPALDVNEVRRMYDEGLEIPFSGEATSRPKDVFAGGHFDESNVLAHMRLNDRTGPDGEKILFVEEIQSDWHQKGRKQGYLTKNDAEVKSLIAEKDAIVNRGTINPADGSLTIQLQDLDRYNELVSQIEPRLPVSTAGVPDAPLKKTWHEMSFRRIARMAAEEGYDAIAWTPGKMQAERYDLSKRISEISYDPDTKKLFAYEKDGYSPVISEVVSEDKLADHIGKEATERLLATTRKTIPTDKGDTSQHILKGADLEVGGKFHKDLYDKKVKQYADKWGKKFGAKVGVTEIGGGGEFTLTNPIVDDFVDAIQKAASAKDEWVQLKLLDALRKREKGQSPKYVFGNLEEDEIKKYIPSAISEGGENEVWTLPVTKKMRDSVLRKGVATFGAAGVAAGLNNQEARPNGN